MTSKTTMLSKFGLSRDELEPCFYCDAEADGLDHVIARSRGGPDEIWNLVPACQSCNNSKRNHSVSGWLERIEARWNFYNTPCNQSCRCCSVNAAQPAKPPPQTHRILARKNRLLRLERDTLVRALDQGHNVGRRLLSELQLG